MDILTSNSRRFTYVGDRDSGTRDHFFHFLLGYVLPSLHRALKDGIENVSYEDCGPLLNKTLADICQLMALNLIPENAATQFDVAPVARWDKWIFRLDGSEPPPKLTERFLLATDVVRDQMIHRSLAYLPTDSQSPDIIVLKRSHSHPYYQTTGQSPRPGYGRERRNLQNTDEIADAIANSGFSVRTVDMGSIPFAEQVCLFHHAKAVIGARGAEFAHLFWMRKNTDALMFATPISKPNHATRTLAHIRGIRLREVPVTEEHFNGSLPDVSAWLSSLKRRMA